MAHTFIQIFDIKSESRDLEALIYDMAVKSGLFVPLNKTTFKYKNYMILKGPDELWHTFMLKPNKQHIGRTFLKVSAFAICKLHDKGSRKLIEEVRLEDQIFERNYIDSLYYKKTYQRTKDPATKDTALWRYEIVQAKAKAAKARIDGIFYSSIA